jgi:hypothetical protein
MPGIPRQPQDSGAEQENMTISPVEYFPVDDEQAAAVTAAVRMARTQKVLDSMDKMSHLDPGQKRIAVKMAFEILGGTLKLGLNGMSVKEEGEMTFPEILLETGILSARLTGAMVEIVETLLNDGYTGSCVELTKAGERLQSC